MPSTNRDNQSLIQHNDYTYFAFCNSSEHYANTLTHTLNSSLSDILLEFYKYTYRQPYPAVFKYFLADHIKYSPNHHYVQNPTSSKRGTHGEGHANGVAIASVIFFRLYELYGTSYVRDEITAIISSMPAVCRDQPSNFLKLLQVAAAFHDAGRLGGAADQQSWEKKGANDCYLFILKLLTNSNVEHEQAVSIANLFSNAIYDKDQKYDQSKSIIKSIIQCADCIEIMRCKSVFRMDYLDIWNDACGKRDGVDRVYIEESDKDMLKMRLEHVARDWRELIRYQGRLTKPAAIHVLDSSNVRVIDPGIKLNEISRLIDTASSREEGSFSSFANDLFLGRFIGLSYYYGNHNSIIASIIDEGVNTSVEQVFSAIEEVPTSEIKYYLLSLAESLLNNRVKNGAFIDELGMLINDIKLLMEMISSQNITDQLPNQFDIINKRYQKLLDLSHTNSLYIKVGYALLNVICAVAAVLCGIIGGLIGGVSGFARSLLSFTNPLQSIGVGMVLGIYAGAYIGFRSMESKSKDRFIMRLKYCLDGLRDCINSMQSQVNSNLSSYEDIVVRNYFGGDRDKFEQFKQLEAVSYSVETLNVDVFQPTIEYLYHHVFIKIEHELINIKLDNNKQANIALLELKTGNSDLKSYQNEKRAVSGSKLVEMLCLHEQLQATHRATFSNFTTKYDVDCLSYVNKILTCTNQDEAHIIPCIDRNNSFVRNIVGFFIPALENPSYSLHRYHRF